MKSLSLLRSFYADGIRWSRRDLITILIQIIFHSFRDQRSNLQFIDAISREFYARSTAEIELF